MKHWKNVSRPGKGGGDGFGSRVDLGGATRSAVDGALVGRKTAGRARCGSGNARMKLSIVVACLNVREKPEECLSALEHASGGIDAEIVAAVAGASDDTTREIERRHPTVACLRHRAGTLVPELWAAGLRHASGEVVAFTIAPCRVSPTWARALIDAVGAGATGVGGPLDLSDDTGPIEWATFYLRYSAFVSEQFGDGPVAGEIAGDNAAYAATALRRHEDAFAAGFWEIEFHRLIRAEGGALVADSRATAFYRGGTPYLKLVAHRFAHGRQFGASRVASGTRSVWVSVLLAPAVPFVLALRAGRRLLPVPRHRTRFVLALPALIGLAAAWAAGEALGALAGADSRDVLQRPRTGTAPAVGQR